MINQEEDLMMVVGRTTEQEAYVASIHRPFKKNEYFLIHYGDTDIIGEVIETYYYPMITASTVFPTVGIYESLLTLFSFDKKEFSQGVYLGKWRAWQEQTTPIPSHVVIKAPNYKNIETIFRVAPPSKGLVIGVIAGTEELTVEVPDEMKNLLRLSEKGKLMPQIGMPLLLNAYSFQQYPHILIVGSSGSGKTNAIRSLAEEIMQKQIPGIMLDPHFEMNFDHSIEEKEWFPYHRQHEIFVIGQEVGIDFTDLRTEELISLLRHFSQLSDPMMATLQKLHANKDSFASLINRINALKNAIENMEKPKNQQSPLSSEQIRLYEQYKDTVSGWETLQALSWRLTTLQSLRIFGSGIQKIEEAMMKRKLVILRGDVIQIKMTASYIIGKLYRRRRAYKDGVKEAPRFPPFFIISDEAHLFAPNNEQYTPTKSLLREIALEARKYGIYEVLGTQSPSLLDSTIASQMNTQIVFQIKNREDLDMLKSSTNLQVEEIERLPNLTVGKAYLSSPLFARTIFLQFRVANTKSPHHFHPYDELSEYGDDQLKEVLLSFLPFNEFKLPKIHSLIDKKMEKHIDIREIQLALDELVEDQVVVLEPSPMGKSYTLHKPME